MIDMVVHRHKLRATLSGLCRVLTKAPVARTPSVEAPMIAAPTVPALPAPADEPEQASLG